jgi:Mg2+/Co2+ transporter CorB
MLGLDSSLETLLIYLRKLRVKQLLDKPGRAARTIAALLTLRDQVISPILAAVRSLGTPFEIHEVMDNCHYP